MQLCRHSPPFARRGGCGQRQRVECHRHRLCPAPRAAGVASPAAAACSPLHQVWPTVRGLETQRPLFHMCTRPQPLVMTPDVLLFLTERNDRPDVPLRALRPPPAPRQCQGTLRRERQLPGTWTLFSGPGLGDIATIGQRCAWDVASLRPHCSDSDSHPGGPAPPVQCTCTCPGGWSLARTSAPSHLGPARPVPAACPCVPQLCSLGGDSPRAPVRERTLPPPGLPAPTTVTRGTTCPAPALLPPLCPLPARSSCRTPAPPSGSGPCACCTPGLLGPRSTTLRLRGEVLYRNQ